jgi:hypothetical protein
VSDLTDLGTRHKQLLHNLDEIKPLLHNAMRAAWAERDQTGITQREIMEQSGYKTIQQVRVILGLAKPATKAGQTGN